MTYIRSQVNMHKVMWFLVNWHDAEKHPVLNMHNGLTNGKVYVNSDKQIHMNLDTIVSFVIQSGQVLDGGTISVSRHVNWK